MVKRPVSLTVIAWLFIIVGGAGLADALFPLATGNGLGRLAGDPTEVRDLAFVLTLRLLALLGGAFVLRGADWTRWLLAAWMTAHIAISLQHSWLEAVMHAGVFSVVAYVLFRPPAAAYFRDAGAPAGT